MNSKAYHIIHTALEKLQQLTGLKGLWYPNEKVPGLLDGTVKFTNGSFTDVFVAEIKNEVRNHHLQNITDTAKTALHPFILVGGNIYPSVKEYLRKQGINYVDIAGNTFIKQGDTLIYIEGQKWKDDTHPQALNRAFTKTGLKITFVLLKDPGAVNYPTRTLALLARVSVGAVNSALSGLKMMTFIGLLSKGRYRIDLRETLIDRWVSGYQERLKPDLLIGNFKSNIDWESMRLDGSSYWGGEAAAWKLRKHLVPATVMIYTDDSRTEFMKKHRLVPDPEGPIMLYQKFWDNGMLETYTGIAPRLLVYADLMDTMDPRCIEEAQEIYKEL